MISRTEFRRFAATLAGTGFVEQWGGLVAKVSGKVFAMRGEVDERPGVIVVKVAETSFEILTALDDIGQAPYFAKGKWVAIGPGALPDSEVKHYIGASHRLAADGLSKKLQRELGLLAAP